MAKKTAKEPSEEQLSPKISGMISDLNLLRDTIAEGVPLETRFTVRQVDVIPSPRNTARTTCSECERWWA